MRQFPSLLGSLSLALLAGCNDPSATSTSPSKSSLGATVGNVAPALEGKDTKGNMVKLSELKGKVVVVDFWATWCGPCKAAIPHEKELVKKLAGRPFVLLGVSADQKPEHLEEFLAQDNLPWPNIFDGMGGPLAREWNIEYFPTFYIIDANGVIRRKIVGTQEDLEAPILNLLAEVEGKAK